MKTKEELTPHVVAVTALAVFIVLGLACASKPSAAETATAQAPAAERQDIVQEGTGVSWNLSPGGVAWYSVRATVNGPITVETSGNTDTVLEAYDDPPSHIIVSDDNGGQGRNARVQINAVAGRTYFFKVRGNNRNVNGFFGITAVSPAGSLDITVVSPVWEETARQEREERQRQEELARQEREEQRRQVVQTSTELPLGGAGVSGNLSPGTEVWYNVRATENDRIIVETSGNINTYMEAYDESHYIFASDNDSGQGSNARLQINAIAGRTYLFKVRGFDGIVSGSFGIVAATPAQMEAARQARGHVSLYSAYTGTVLVNGTETEFRVEAGQEVAVTIENARGNEYTLAVREPSGTVRQASSRVKIEQGTTYQAQVLDPNPPPNPADDFDIIQNAQGGITITGYKGTRKQVVIPTTIHGVRVTAIGGSAFSDKGLFSVTLPDTVTEISNDGDGPVQGGAFSGNPTLTRVSLGSGLKIIGTLSFAGANLGELALPAGVTDIGNYAFSGSGLTKITLPASLKLIGESAFYGNRLESVTIPNGVTMIGGDVGRPVGADATSVFWGNPITTVVIPASLAAYSEQTSSGFWGSVTRQTAGIRSNAFRDCPITRITLPANMDDRNMRTFEEGLRNFYTSQNKAAGTYVKNGPIWTRQ